MSKYTIYHNPRCSKSRQTLQLLQQNGIEPEIRLYLQQAPGADEICELLSKLGIEARALLRRGESEYKEQQLANPALSDSELVQAMAKTPKLIERPVVVRGDRAVLGRPPENVLDLINA